ncbi:MAG: hypothetical protein Q9219_003530 [cf. Caloplaca sp. 3 TL-2023]
MPANGTYDRWDEQSARALTSEVITMKFLHSNTSVPVPRVFGFSSTTANPIKCPFILMEYIEGISLFHGWYYPKSVASQEAFREKAIANIAKAMAQLNTFTFPKSGSLRSVSCNKAIDIGPYRKVDLFTEFELLKSGEYEGKVFFSQHGPFTDPKDYFLTSLNEHDKTKQSPCLQGQRKLLRLFINWFFQATSGDTPGSDFVLTHPDFNLQNIIMGEDGSVRGFIDWDGVAAVPRCLGNEEYPLWLTSDWDPYWWNYDLELERPIDENDPVMGPAEMERYRALYVRSIETALQQQNGQEHVPQQTTTQMTDGGCQRFSRTKVSPLARSLYIAANEPLSLESQVELIFDKITALTRGEDFTDPSHTTDGRASAHYHKIDHDVNHQVNSVGGPPIIQEFPLLDTQSSSQGPLSSLETTASDTNTASQVADQVQSISLDKGSLLNPEDRYSIAVEQNTEAGGQQIVAETSPSGLRATISHKENDTGRKRRRDFTMWASTILRYLILLPAFPILFLDWLQAWGISPIMASFIGLLFCGSKPVSNSVAFALGGLFYAWLIDQVFSEQKTWSKKYGSKKIAKGFNYVPSVRFDQSDHGNINIRHGHSPKTKTLKYKPSLASLTQPSPAKSHSSSASDSSDKDSPLFDRPRSRNTSSSATSTDTHLTEPSVAPASPPSPHPSQHQNGNDHPISSGQPTAQDLRGLPTEECVERIKRIWEEDPTHDFGTFTVRDVYNALSKGSLDGTRMRRLKVGFQRLLAELDAEFEGFDGLGFRDEI